MNIEHFHVVIFPNFANGKEEAMEEPLEKLPLMPEGVDGYDLRKTKKFPNELFELPQLSPADLPKATNSLYLRR